ncbi:ABC transporter permease [Corallococcus sp. M34]|uniref:ADOP family duplicated permease n=1 Tax=Citreicoccus inhibens TaxID=2849499 RepID=UPI001C2355CB|nr:ADOP family duplicated permease [Citreicoccus inhibens]MBU8900364.1 ABC transporter permease [Citreicoccus inhibens]
MEFSRFLDGLRQDFTSVRRLLTHSSGLSFVVVASLGLGLGATIAVFGLIDAVMLRPLPVTRPEQLYAVGRNLPERGYQSGFAPELVEGLRHERPAGVSAITGLFAEDGSRLVVGTGSEAEMVSSQFLAGNGYQVLGVRAQAGRLLSEEDDHPGAEPVVVLSDAWWALRFGRSPSVIGTTLVVGGIASTIIGVTPREYFGLARGDRPPQVTLPLWLQSRLGLNDHQAGVVVRLAEGATPQTALAELSSLHDELLKRHPSADPSLMAARLELRSIAHGESFAHEALRLPLLLLLGMVMLMLLVACGNVANLLLAQAIARRRELAVRQALGARSGHIVRQLLVESGALSGLAAVVGLLTAWWMGDGLLLLLSEDTNYESLSFHPSARVMLFSILAAVGTTFLCGLFPALRATRSDTVQGIHRGQAGGAPRSRFARALVVLQVALSMVLLSGAGLLLRSVRNIEGVQLGFEREQVLLASIYPSLLGYEQTREVALYTQLAERLGALPGVRAASVSRAPFFGGYFERRLDEDGAGGSPSRVSINAVTPRFFDTMGVALVAGRDVDTSDSAGAARVAVISQSLAQHLAPGMGALGHVVRLSGGGEPLTVVGIAKDIRPALRDDAGRTRWAIYVPLTQASGELLGQATIEVRTQGAPLSFLPALRKEVEALAPGLPLLYVRTQDDVVRADSSTDRSLALLASTLGACALVLAVVGLSGVLLYSVRQRTRELAVRRALGASAWSVASLVLRDAVHLAGVGLGLGIPVALVTARLGRSVLFGVAPDDLLTLSAATALLFVICVVASLRPVILAARLPVSEALRAD